MIKLKDLLKESSPGFENRQVGDSLPTLDSVQTAYQTKKAIEERLNLFVEENVPTDASKWSYYKSQAKKKFDVYPSAYANGWAAKKYKAAGGGWKTEK